MLSRDDNFRNQANDFFLQGLQHYSGNAFETAIEQWMLAVDAINLIEGDGEASKVRENDFRNLGNYHYYIAMAYIKSGDCKSAIWQYRCAILAQLQINDSSTNDVSVLADCRLSLASLYYSLDQWKEGIEQYEQVIALGIRTEADVTEDDACRALAQWQQEMARGYKALNDMFAAVRCYLDAFDSLSVISKKSVADFTGLDAIYATLTGIFALYDDYFEKVDDVKEMKQLVWRLEAVDMLHAQAASEREHLQALQRQVEQLNAENAELRIKLSSTVKVDNPGSQISLSGPSTMFSQSAPRRSNRLQKKMAEPSGMTNGVGLTMLCEAAEYLRRQDTCARK